MSGPPPFRLPGLHFVGAVVWLVIAGAGLVVSAPDVNAPQIKAALAELSEKASATGEMSAALQTRVNPAGDVATVSIPLAGDGTDSASNHALETLRSKVIPSTIGAVPGAHAYVTGETAGSHDFGTQLADRAPWVFLFVLGLISLSIALLNLLPLLPLDGGHIVFAVAEGVRGRTVRREIYEKVSVVGLGIVLLLFFIGLTNDIGRLS